MWAYSSSTNCLDHYHPAECAADKKQTLPPSFFFPLQICTGQPQTPTLFLCKSVQAGHGVSTRGENKDEGREVAGVLVAEGQVEGGRLRVLAPHVLRDVVAHCRNHLASGEVRFVISLCYCHSHDVLP